MEKGYVQIYTGDGKGKTTCMLGLTLRACGADKKVFIGQFMKKGDYSEIKALKKYLPCVTVEQFGGGGACFEKGKQSQHDIEVALKGFERAKDVLSCGVYDIVILDEVNVVVNMGLLSIEQQLELIKAKAENTELVMTGRYASAQVIEKADLVTEMTMVKHYYKDGVDARVGIEM